MNKFILSIYFTGLIVMAGIVISFYMNIPDQNKTIEYLQENR